MVQLSGGVQRYMEAAEAGSLPGRSVWRGKLFNFDDRPAGATVTGAPASPHQPGVLGRCVRCAAPWDDYRWLRCAPCGVLVLVCDGCAAGAAAAGGGAEQQQQWRAALRCAECAAAGGSAASAAAAAARAGKGVRRSRKRGPRPDLAAAAAERRRAAGAKAAEEEGVEASGEALAGLFWDSDEGR